MKIDFPTIVEKTEEEIASIITIIKNRPLSDDIKLFIIKCIELVIWLPNFVLNTKISMYRFATIIFGKGYRRKQHKDIQNNKPIDNDNSQSSSSPANLSQHASSELIPVDNNSIAPCEDSFTQLIDNSKKSGHGRMPHTAYTKCIKVELTLELKIGDPCPYSGIF